MRYHLFCLSLFKASLTLFSSSALSALQPIEEAPLASEIDHHCHFKDDGTTKCTSTYHYTILRPSGREEISRIDFNFNEDDKLTVEKAELTQPGKKAVPLDKSRIDTRLAPNPAKGFLREKQTSIAFPNLRIGTRVSYTLQQDYAAKPMISGFHYIYNEHPSPQRIDRLNVKFTAERPIVWRSERMENFNITHKKDKKELVITLKKPPYYLNYVNEANGSYVRQIPRIELASSLDLQDNFGAIAKRYNEILAAKLPPLSAEVVSNIKEKTPEQKVTAVMQHIYDNYRYLGDWRGSERGYIPFSLSEIEEHGYGDCKDLAILLTAMLKASGIKAQPAWIKRGVFAPTLLIPGIKAPNHAIVRAEVNGKTWWLDPTNPVFTPGRTMSDLQERWVFVADETGQVKQETIPAETPDVNQKVTREERFSDGTKAQVELNLELANDPLMQLSKDDQHYGKFSVDKELCSQFAKESQDCEIKRAETAFVMPEHYKMTATLTDLAALQKVSDQYIYHRSSDKLTAIWKMFSAYRREGNLADVFIGDPQTILLETTLRGGNISKQPLHCEIRSPWFDIDMKSEPSKDDSYHYSYKKVEKVRWLTHDEINSGEFKELIDKSVDCFEKLRLNVQLTKKEPAKKA